MSEAAISDNGRHPSATGCFIWEPAGPGVDPVLLIHVTLVWVDPISWRPCAIYLTPDPLAADYGSQLHGRCEETGILLSWSLRGGKRLPEMAEGLKPNSLSGGTPLALFACRAALRLNERTALDAPIVP